jgi:prepilin-type N-terminal cleavage/methylation domain-containing protein
MSLPEVLLMPGLNHRRKAFTLMELLVVIGLLALLMALTAVYFVTFNPSEQTRRGSDQLAAWLLSARQQAKRDGRPTGVVLVDGNGNPLPANGAPPLFASGVVFIQQPDDFAQGVYIGRNFTQLPGPANRQVFNIAQIQSPTVDLTNTTFFPVLAGDYFELSGGGVLRRIINFPNSKPPSPVRLTNPTARPELRIYELCLAPVPPVPNPPTPFTAADYTGIDLPDPGGAIPPPTGPGLVVGTPPTLNGKLPLIGPANYRIIPQPRILASEAPRMLPENVVIDCNVQPWNTNYSPNGALSNPPTRPLPPSPSNPNPKGLTQFEVLFSPSGSVIGRSSAAGMIWLWVRNLDRGNLLTNSNINDNAGDRLFGRPVLVTIQTRTGFIAQHPVAGEDLRNPPPAAQSDPYQLARGGRASGL